MLNVLDRLWASNMKPAKTMANMMLARKPYSRAVIARRSSQIDRRRVATYFISASFLNQERIANGGTLPRTWQQVGIN